jgi:5-methylcytosine-specific restriction endonuclease McrA
MKQKIKQAIQKDNPLYFDFMYNLAKEQVLIRDSYQCVKCKSDKQVTVHHIKPRNRFPELTCDLDNMITLCQKCHVKVHKKI